MESPQTLQEEPIETPYPRQELLPEFPAVWKRIGVDLISFGMGWVIGSFKPDAGNELTQLILGAIGVVLAFLFERGSIALAAQSVGFGFAGVALGLTLLPEKVPDYGGNYSEGVFFSGVVALVLAMLAGAGFWSVRNWGKTAPPDLCDGYQAFRACIGRTPAHVMLAGISGGMLLGAPALFVFLLLGLYYYETDRAVRLTCLNKSAVIWTVWTPIMLTIGLTLVFVHGNLLHVDTTARIGIGLAICLAFALSLLRKPVALTASSDLVQQEVPP